MNKVVKAKPRERTSQQNGMPEPVPYVYRQQGRRNDWAARIARRNAQGWRQPPPAALSTQPKADAHGPDLRVLPLTIPVTQSVPEASGSQHRGPEHVGVQP
jgi:hypothetical protein